MTLIESNKGPICPILKNLLKAIGYNTYIPLMGFIGQGKSALVMCDEIQKFVRGLSDAKATELQLGLTADKICTFEVPLYMYHSLTFILDYVKEMDYSIDDFRRIAGRKRTFASSNMDTTGATFLSFGQKKN